MQDKLETIKNKIELAWGPLPLRDTTFAVNTFDRALCSTLPDPSQAYLAKAIASLFVRGLKLNNVTPETHVEKSVITGIIQDHIDKRTAYYVYTASFAHHAAEDDQCEGTDSDYCHHPLLRTHALFDRFEDGRTQAFELLHNEVLDGLPPEATNAEVLIQVYDGDHLVPLGKCGWDKCSSASYFEPTGGRH